MKKHCFFITFLMFLISIPNISFGILSDVGDLDMYKKVDKGLYDLQLKYLDKELKGGQVGGSITDDLNKRAEVKKLQKNCFKGSMSASDAEKINNGDTKVLNNFIDSSCKDKDGTIGDADFVNLLNVVKESYGENSQKAETKVDNIYKIGKIGMYSDGIDENSPFDLMSDLKEIDKIIFEQEIPYNGVNTFDLGMVTDGVLNGMSMNEALRMGGYKDHIMFQGKYGNPIYPQEPTGSVVDGNNQVCTTNSSGLDTSSLSGILSDLKSKNLSLGGKPANDNSGVLVGGIGNNNNNNNIGGGGYSRVNDNAFWPCNQFFCIIIKFVVYQHNLLGGGNNLSIEGLIKRSNDHFKKFASSSLVQSRMTTNLFELGLKDLNLPDIFHVGTQVSYKPVPILNVEPGNKEKETDEFKHKNLLTRYYRNLGLDYERANDLVIFRQKEAQLKSLIDSAELVQVDAQEKNNNFQSHIEEIQKENNFVSNNVVDKKVLDDDVQDFYKQFAELKSFTNAMLDYTIGAGGVLNKMKQIPQGN